MSDLQFNEETGEWGYADGIESQASSATAPSATSLLLSPEEQKRRAAQEQIEQNAATATPSRVLDERPLFAETPGQFAGDLVKSVVNPAAALVTDYVDLGHGLVDIAGQTGSWLSGNGFDGSKIFDDSDNPLTKARIDSFRSESQAGQFVNTTARVVVALATLPKLALKGLAMPLRLLGKAPAVGGIATKGANLLTKTPTALKGTAGITKGLDNAAKLKGAGKATKLANADDWLKLTYKDLINAGPDAEKFAFGMRTIERTAKSLVKGKVSVRSVGEALAWDAFVAFNAAGEGNPMLDETMTDMFEEFGLPNIPIFRTSLADTPLEAKFKQMGEGLIFNPVVESVMNVARIARFSKAFKNAAPAERRAIAAAFSDEAGELGVSVAKLEELAEFSNPKGYGPRTKAGTNFLDEQLSAVEQVRIKNQLDQEMQANLLKREALDAKIDDQINAVDLRNRADNMGQPLAGPEGAPRQVTVRGNEQAQLPPGVKGGPLANGIKGVDVEDVTVQPVNVQVMRPPEPTVTPQTLRAGFDDYVRQRFGEAGFEADLVDRVKRLMPRNRVDAIDFFEKFPLRYNGIGTMSAADSISSNYMIARGMSEGWMTVDSDMLLMYNRKLAFDFDRNEFALKQASALDEADEIARYNARLQKGATDPETQGVQRALDPDSPAADARKATNEYDDFEARPKDGGGVPDEAFVEAKRREALAATEEAGAAAAERQQMIDAVAAYGDIGSDRQVVAEMLNLDLDNLPQYQIDKVGNRQYQILDEAGESIDGRNYLTLKGAKKGAEIAQKEQAKQYIAQARAAAARSSDQVVGTSFGTTIRDSELVRGAVKLTKRQGEVLGELGIPLNQLDLDLSQNELAGMSRSVQQLLESADGPQKRVLNNILKRLDQKVSELGPAARLAVEVDKTITSAQKFLKDGEICF
jgi:hypothetical protein